MIFALKTDGPTTGLWLVPTDKLNKKVVQEQWESGRDLAEELLARIEAFLDQSQLELKDLTGIIIFSGPGSFTSLRIGHSVANGLADSLDIPVVGAAGENWLEGGLEAIKTATPVRPALPVYGSEAHITRPKH